MKARKPTTLPPPPAAASTALTIITDGMRQAIANADPTEEPRAFPIFDDVPPGHFLFQVENERHEPHLHDREWVVIDSTSRDVVFGEVYLILHSSGPRLHQITRFGVPEKIVGYDGRPVAMLSPLSRPRFLPNGDVDLSGPLYLSDGPIYVDNLLPDVLGRVVGIIDPGERFDRRQREATLRRAEKERASHKRPPQIEGGAR